MFVADRQAVLDAIKTMGPRCCSYSVAEWPGRCDCKYGVGEGPWPTAHERGNGCPELASLYMVIGALTDEEWALLVHRANGTPRGFVFADDVGSRLHRAEAAAAMAAENIANVRAALSPTDEEER